MELQNDRQLTGLSLCPLHPCQLILLVLFLTKGRNF